MQGMYSMRSPAVKRLMKEAQELSEPTEQYYCQPLEDNLFEWHFTLRGPADTEFEGGLYHGRIILPPEYPMKPPSIILLTHNGRFEINKKICLSISGHHPESWQPSWSIRTALLAIIGFMPTHGAGALGSLDYTPDERKVLARKSIDFKCSECGPINHTLKAVTEASLKTREDAKQLAAQMDFKNEKEKNAALKKETTEETKQSTKTDTSGTTESGISQSATGAIPKVKTNQPFPQPAQFGQFPMPLPFLPPFPIPGNTQNGQQQGNNVLNQVPRFPLPFAAPFSPPFPQFMPPMPMVPGMSFPAVPAGNRISRTSESGSETMRSHPPTESTSQSDQIQCTQSSVVSSSQPSENLPTTTSTPSTLLQSQSTTQTTDEGLRQRNVTETTNVTPQRATTPIQRRTQAEIPRESVAFVVFAVIILSLIAVLLLRRLYMMKYLSGLI